MCECKIWLKKNLWRFWNKFVWKEQVYYYIFEEELKCILNFLRFFFHIAWKNETKNCFYFKLWDFIHNTFCFFILFSTIHPKSSACLPDLFVYTVWLQRCMLIRTVTFHPQIELKLLQMPQTCFLIHNLCKRMYLYILSIWICRLR